jgi:2-isopropylmalate synthase
MTKIIDATLREGNQSPNVRFTVEQSIEIASMLNAIDIEMIEIGHPSASPLEMERVRSVAGIFDPAKILSHARALQADVNAVAESGAKWVGIFAGINELSQKYRLNNRTKEQILELISLSVRGAKRLGLSVRYTVEDSSRTPFDLLSEAYETALRAGADRICFADTVGWLEPQETHRLIAAIKQRFDADLEVHFHDDRGLALSNSLAAIDAGANWISCSINGLGERCGITDTCSMLTNLRYRTGRVLVPFDRLHDLSHRIAEISDSPPDARRPVIGKHAFLHTAKLHRDAMQRNSSTYTWMG